MVLGTGVEPARPKTLEPKPNASANSATRATKHHTLTKQSGFGKPVIQDKSIRFLYIKQGEPVDSINKLTITHLHEDIRSCCKVRIVCDHEQGLPLLVSNFSQKVKNGVGVFYIQVACRFVS